MPLCACNQMGASWCYLACTTSHRQSAAAWAAWQAVPQLTAMVCRDVLPRYKSVLVSKKWMLKGVSGECNSDELPSHPSPSFPPEAVVEAQLAALR
mgnify:CR=1 FL=1